MNRITTIEGLLDHVEKFLVKQGQPSLAMSEIDGNSCLYRGINNTSCGVGCLISDAKYKEDLEGHSSDDLLADCPEVFEDFLDMKVLRKSGVPLRRVLGGIQEVHDMFEHVRVAPSVTLDWEQYITKSFADLRTEYLTVEGVQHDT